jgi:hypothetical protein
MVADWANHKGILPNVCFATLRGVVVQAARKWRGILRVNETARHGAVAAEVQLVPFEFPRTMKTSRITY